MIIFLVIIVKIMMFLSLIMILFDVYCYICREKYEVTYNFHYSGGLNMGSD